MRECPSVSDNSSLSSRWRKILRRNDLWTLHTTGEKMEDGAKMSFSARIYTWLQCPRPETGVWSEHEAPIGPRHWQTSGCAESGVLRLLLLSPHVYSDNLYRQCMSAVKYQYPPLSSPALCDAICLLCVSSSFGQLEMPCPRPR